MQIVSKKYAHGQQCVSDNSFVSYFVKHTKGAIMNTASLSLQKKYTFIVKDREKHPGQSVASFCKSHGITPWCFYYWQKRLKSTLSIQRDKFIPVSVYSPTVQRGKSQRYAIRFPSGETLGISGDFDRAQIRELVDILRGA
jgi:hypothetical protein